MIKKKGANGISEFTGERKANTAPKIVGSFIDDDGVEMYITESGKTVIAERHNSLWNPPKQDFRKKFVKGPNPGKYSLFKQ